MHVLYDAQERAMTATEAFAAFLDFCCARYVKSASYRRTLNAERPQAGEAR